MIRYCLFNTANIWILLLAALLNSCMKPEEPVNDQFSYAQERKNDLQLSIYITAHAVQNLLSDKTGRREAISLLRCNGITKAYIEVYRGGLVVEKELLEDVRDFFEENQIETVGGIATVPGKDFGVRQEAQYDWFNWQNPKTQADLKEVMIMSADVFDEFIIDDFLCTDDTSAESKAAKGDRSWSQYRRDLLNELTESIFIGPAKSINPDIELIIKYPQWYDRYHLFGYDVEYKNALYDKVWIGTETRGKNTPRYGFVQPYESFVSYKWMNSLAGNKMGGAWFDHIDCDANDFIEQAWQSVLAGARELILFNYFDFVSGHGGHHLLRIQFPQLADLAAQVARDPVKGVMAYKPPSSDAFGDHYVMDYIGMLGIPLIPVSHYPDNAEVIFLPTQAAADTGILAKIENSITNEATLVFTTGFLAHARDGKRLAEIAGINWPLLSSPITADQIIVDGKTEIIKYGLDLESAIQPSEGSVKLAARYNTEDIPFLVARDNIITLNLHTFSQADFDEVDEVLLCPQPLGLMEMPQTWANTIRDALLTPFNYDFNAPARVTLQPLGQSGWLIHNYNGEAVHFDLGAESLTQGTIIDKFSGKQVEVKEGRIEMEIPPRSRLWLEISE